jgi:hypothetical protein
MDNTMTLPTYHKCDVCVYTSILKANYDRHCMTKKHLKNIEKHIEKIEVEADKFLENGGGESDGEIVTKEQLHNMIQDTYDEVNKKYEYEFDYATKTYESYISPVKNDTFLRDDIFYAKIYNTLFELKRQYPNKYEFVRNTERMKREWVRWTQEQFENDFVYCYTKWFGRVSKVNNELVGKFIL